MGANQASQNNKLQQVYQQFKIVRIESNGITYLQQKITEKQFMLKQFATNSLEEFQNLQKIIHNKQKLVHQHLLQIKGIYSKTQNNFCSNFYKIYMIIEYPFRNLFQEIDERRLKKYQWFSENQLWSILYSCILAIKYLHSIGLKHQLLCSSRIYIEKDGIIKIADPDLLGYENRFMNKNKDNHIYASPQQLQQIKIKLDDSSDIFSLGMILLQAANLQFMDEIYNNNTINLKRLNEKMKNLTKRYSQKFKNILQRMLIINFRDRIKLNEIQQIIQNQDFEQEQRKIQEKYSINKRLQNTMPSQISLNMQSQKNSSQLPIYTSNYQYLGNLNTITQNYNNQNFYPSSIINPNPLYSNYNNLQSRSYVNNSINLQNYNYTFTNPLTQNIPMHTSYNFLKPYQQPLNAFSKIGYYDIGTNNNPYTNTQQILNQNKEKLILNDITKNIIDQKNKQNNNIEKKQSIKLNNELKHDQIQNTPIQKLQGSCQTFIELDQNNSNETQNLKIQKQNHYDQYKLSPRFTIVQVNQNQSSSIMNTIQEKKNYITQFYDFGSKYEGYKLNGMRHGFGKFYYQDGGYYQGQWKQNKMHGYAKLYYQNGQLAYEGNWQNDQFHGKGKVFNDNPQQLHKKFDWNDLSNLDDFWIYYSGDFSYDSKSGFGSIKLSNGEMFEGYFQQDAINGQGKFYCLNGDIIKGIWKDNKLQKKLELD